MCYCRLRLNATRVFATLIPPCLRWRYDRSRQSPDQRWPRGDFAAIGARLIRPRGPPRSSGEPFLALLGGVDSAAGVMLAGRRAGAETGIWERRGPRPGERLSARPVHQTPTARYRARPLRFNTPGNGTPGTRERCRRLFPLELVVSESVAAVNQCIASRVNSSVATIDV